MRAAFGSWRVAYADLWRGLLFGRFVQQCERCERTIRASKLAEAMRWDWRFERGRVVWRCPECEAA